MESARLTSMGSGCQAPCMAFSTGVAVINKAHVMSGKHIIFYGDAEAEEAVQLESDTLPKTTSRCIYTKVPMLYSALMRQPYGLTRPWSISTWPKTTLSATRRNSSMETPTP